MIELTEGQIDLLKTYYKNNLQWTIIANRLGIALHDLLPIALHQLSEKVGDCWLWYTGVSHDGYAQLYFNKQRKQAHVFSYEVFNGAINSGAIVMHSCDVRNCVNPKHLIVGTYKDNMEDAATKGRMASGVRNGNAVLNEDKVKEIRQLRQQGLSQPKIAKTVGCSNQTVSVVLSRKVWGHVI